MSDVTIENPPVIAGELMPTTPERRTAVSAVVGAPLKNRIHERFARLCLEHTQFEAYRRALGKRLRATKPSSIHEAASVLAARPEVRQRIAELRGIAARATAFDVATYAQGLQDIIEADVTEIQYRGACRYCHGAGHRYQWIDEDEYTCECAKALDEGRAPEDDAAGGFGYDGSMHPAPDCPRCYGAGDKLFTADVTRLSPKARALFKGFGKHGEVLVHDKLIARSQLAKLMGLDRDDAPSIARAAAAGAAAGAALGAAVASATTPEERMRAYLRLIEG